MKRQIKLSVGHLKELQTSQKQMIFKSQNPELRAASDTGHASAPADNTEEHYRINMFIPFITHIVSQRQISRGNQANAVWFYLVPC